MTVDRWDGLDWFCKRSHQAVYTDDLLNLAASVESSNGSPSGKSMEKKCVIPQ